MDYDDLSEVLEQINVWPPLNEPDVSVVMPEDEHEAKIIKSLVDMVKIEKFKDRKNSYPHLVHPLSVTHYLQKAGSSFLSQCAGILHDYVEELVDCNIEKMRLDNSSENFSFFDMVETQLLIGLEEDLDSVFSNGPVSGAYPDNITETVRLLTRHKRHRYYASINGIFSCEEQETRDAAIKVKLADRTHNILTLDSFNEQQALYQCFKNLFILNEAKKYLRATNQLSDGVSQMTPAEKLFRKCGKATYGALWFITEKAKTKVITNKRDSASHAVLTLDMAFQKFDKIYKGLEKVTRPDPQESHPMRLFQGVVLKYDSHLHKDGKEYKRRNRDELKYCSSLFKSNNLSYDQIKALVVFKDAFSLREVMGHLLYKKDYDVRGFGCSMCTRDQIC
jgi:hypothetical protein